MNSNSGEYTAKNGLKITLRLEEEKDYRDVEILTREAFWGYSGPTCDEYYLAHLLRNCPAFIRELDYVAVSGAEIVGSIMYSRAKVIDIEGTEHGVLMFGPLSVSPKNRNCGIGSVLVRHTVLAAKRLGYRAVVIYGHPDYYPRFGFCNAKKFNITTPSGENPDALMALPLYGGALDGICGKFYEDAVFAVNPDDALSYDGSFPYKEPAKMQPIDILLERLAPAARKAFIDRDITTLAWLNRLSGREMLTWEGIDEQALGVVNRTLKEYGYAEKLLPSSDIIRRAELGIKALEDG